MKKLKLRQGVKNILVGILLFSIASGVVIMINYRIEQTQHIVQIDK